MAYVLGFFAADGSMLKNKRGGHFIEFTSTDQIILKLIQTTIGSTHRIQRRNRNKDNSAVWKIQYRLQIGSKEWFRDLTRLTLTQRKSNTLVFPKVPSRYLSDFIRGYFDGDGCVYFSRHLQYADRKKPRKILMTLFTSGSRSFLESLWVHIKRRGVRGGSLKKKNRGFELVFSHADSLALHHIMYHTDTALELCLPRKREKLEKAIQELGLAVVV